MAEDFALNGRVNSSGCCIVLCLTVHFVFTAKLVTALEEIAENGNPSGPGAHILMKSMTDFSLLFCLKRM